MRIIRINKFTNAIINVELWDIQPIDTDVEYFVVTEVGEIGGTYVNGTVTPPVPLTPPVPTYTPAQIVAAFTVLGIADNVLSNTDELTKARFYTAVAVREDAPELLGALQANAKTITDFKAVVV